MEALGTFNGVPVETVPACSDQFLDEERNGEKAREIEKDGDRDTHRRRKPERERECVCV